MKKQKPIGFVAICQCGEMVGAMDYQRTERKDAGKLLGQWLAEGCKVEPRFPGWRSELITSCKCGKADPSLTWEQWLPELVKVGEDLNYFTTGSMLSKCKGYILSKDGGIQQDTECWKTYFDSGYSPESAIKEDISQSV